MLIVSWRKLTVSLVTSAALFLSYNKNLAEFPIPDRIDQVWLEQDQFHLEKILNEPNLREKLGAEISLIDSEIRRSENSGLAGKRGYILYLPDTCLKQDILRVALNARQEIVLEPTNAYDIITKFYTSNLVYTGKGFLPVAAVADDSGYSVAEVKNFLDTVKIPNKLLKGLKIYLTPYEMDNGLLGLSHNTNIEGSANDRVLLFRSPKDTQLHTLAHEIGHVVGSELAYDYNLFGFGSPNNFYSLYAGLYGKQYDHQEDYVNLRTEGGVDSWTTEENFAEDFVRLTLPGEAGKCDAPRQTILAKVHNLISSQMHISLGGNAGT